MDKEKIKSELDRLIDEAPSIAPSITRFDDDRSYGRVTDEQLDLNNVMRWELESQALLQQLSALKISVFMRLYEEYAQKKEGSRRHPSRSILVHQVRQMLISARQLTDSPLLAAIPERLNTQAALDTEAGYAFIAMPMGPREKI